MLKDTKLKNIFLLISILVFTIGAYIIGISRNVETYDYWWHIKAGEYIFNNKIVPTKDIYSWFGVLNNLDWTSHEWLSEVLLYIPYKYMGETSGYVVGAFLFVLTGVLIYLFNIESYKKNLMFSLLWTILGVVIIMPTFNPRPHMFSFILFILVLGIIFRFIRHENSKLIWSIPLISILWGNLHGGSSNLPYILCIIALLFGLMNKNYGFIKFTKLSGKKLKTLLVVSVLSILGLMINPHGFEIILYPYINMGDSLMLNVIQEWRAPDLKIISDYPIYILLFVIFVVLIKRVISIDTLDFIYILAFTYLTLKSIRFSPFLYVVASFIIFKYIDEKEWDIKIFSIGALILGVMFIFTFTPAAKESYANFISQELVEKHIIDDIKNHKFSRMYNAYDIGGYLIYNDINPFIDGRADVYSKYTLKDYHIITSMKLNALELIEKYDFDSFLVENGSAIHNHLIVNDEYIEVSKGKNYSLYKKAPI